VRKKGEEKESRRKDRTRCGSAKGKKKRTALLKEEARERTQLPREKKKTQSRNLVGKPKKKPEYN